MPTDICNDKRMYVIIFHADPTTEDNKVQQLVSCIEEISQWMCANRLKLNNDKTQFIWLGTPPTMRDLSLTVLTLTQFCALTMTALFYRAYETLTIASP